MHTHESLGRYENLPLPMIGKRSEAYTETNPYLTSVIHIQDYTYASDWLKQRSTHRNEPLPNVCIIHIQDYTYANDWLKQRSTHRNEPLPNVCIIHIQDYTYASDRQTQRSTHRNEQPLRVIHAHVYVWTKYTRRNKRVLATKQQMHTDLHMHVRIKSSKMFWNETVSGRNSGARGIGTSMRIYTSKCCMQNTKARTEMKLYPV